MFVIYSDVVTDEPIYDDDDLYQIFMINVNLTQIIMISSVVSLAFILRMKFNYLFK